MQDGNNFGKQLRELRKKAGLSQANLAKLVNVKTQTVWRWEAGERTPHLKEMGSIAAALHVTEAELLNGPKRQEWILKIRVSIAPQEDGL